MGSLLARNGLHVCITRQLCNWFSSNRLHLKGLKRWVQKFPLGMAIEAKVKEELRAQKFIGSQNRRYRKHYDGGALAKGRLLLKIFCQEPEIVDLANFMRWWYVIGAGGRFALKAFVN